MYLFRLLNVSTALIVLVGGGCASPTSPSGGPPDKTPPEVVKSVPENGTTEFNGRTIELHFSEYVERSSLSRSLSLSPNLGIEYTLDWGRKSVEVVFKESLPDSTTFILTVGTEFSDVRGNSIGDPVKIAVSTGPTIDKGKLVGFLKRAESGEGESGMKVMLYRKPVDLSTSADYTTDTDTAGRATFPYLSPGTYKAFWVKDRNRNRMWDPDQERAQPFPQEFTALDKSETDSLGTLYVDQADTTRPELMGIGLLTQQRLRLRFSESVEIDSIDQIQILDSTRNAYSGATPLYQPQEEKFVILAHSNRPLQQDHLYYLDIQGVTDPAGNLVQPMKDQSFTGSTQQDTVTQRIIQFESQNGIYHRDSVNITYAKPVTSSVIRDSLVIVEGQSRRTSWEGATIRENKLVIAPDSIWEESVSYQFMPWNPKNEQRETFQPTFWHSSDLGTIRFVRSDTTDSTRYRLQVKSEDERITRSQILNVERTMSDLPPMRYTVKAYYDRDGDQEWDHGSVSPFKSPEPYFIRSGVPVQAGFTSDMIIEFTSHNN